MRLALLTLAMACTRAGDTGDNDAVVALANVQHWAYNIQDVSTARQHDELVGTHFDLYVLEPVVTEAGEEGFDIAGLVQEIRDHNLATRGVDPLVLAYVDIGEAEDWRWYFEAGWGPGDPAWILGEDPNGWEGNYPVAYWDPAWEDIVIYGHDGRSHVDETLAAGFDGLYMDWVEAFSDEQVIAALADAEGLGWEEAEERAATLMLDFVEKIRDHARETDPDYLIVAQNASDLHGWDSDRYESVIDAIALEAIWYDGDGGFDDWADPDGYNVPTNDLYPGWTEEVLGHLEAIDLPIFCVEYAQDVGGATAGTDAYALAADHGFTCTVSRRSLQRLSTTPYPPGYDPIDY